VAGSGDDDGESARRGQGRLIILQGAAGRGNFSNIVWENHTRRK